MDATRWEAIQSIFHAALLCPESERDSYVRSDCGGDEALSGDVLAMLEADKHESVLDRGLPSVAAEVIANADSPPFPEFGPYRLQKLGEGGMGAVWLAQREDTHSLAAVKILPHAALSPARRTRFEIEVRTLASLKHPFIATFHDAGTFDDGTPWFVMEYVEGIGLKQYCQDCSIEKRLQLFRAICEAVQYAHAQGVIHRDLKPSNILVEAKGTPKLLDFGIAKELHSIGDTPERTRPALRFLSPDYAAPEWMNAGAIGIYTDVYSLGVVLYEMLTGQLPPRSSQAAGAQPTPKSSAILKLPLSNSDRRDLDSLWQKATHADAERRYASVDALIRDIDHYLNREPLEARPDGAAYRLRKFLVRHRTAVLAFALALLSVIALAAFFTMRLAQERNTAMSEAARTRTIRNFMQDLLSGDDSEYGPSKDLTVITVLDRGLKKAHMLDADPAAQAEFYNTLANSYTELGEYPKADALLQIALKERTRVFGPRSREVANSLLGFGSLRLEQGNFGDAEAYFRKGLKTAQDVSDNKPQIAEFESGLGIALMDRGSYAAAIGLFSRAVREEQDKPDQIGQYADNMTNLASSHFYLGQYSDAESFSRRAVAFDRELYPENHVGLAEDLINLGNIDHSLMRYAEAETLLRESLALEKKWHGEHHPETADFARTLAQTLEHEGQLQEARMLARQALVDLQKAYGASNARVAMALSVLGRIAADKANFEEAKTEFTRSLEIYWSIYHGKHYYIAIPLEDLGDLYFKQQRYSEAEGFYRDSLRYAAQSLPPDHPLVGHLKIRQAKVLLKQHRYREAEPLLRDGYRILSKQTNAAPAFLADARRGLAELHSQQRATAEFF